jgi:hypothetical protein
VTRWDAGEGGEIHEVASTKTDEAGHFVYENVAVVSSDTGAYGKLMSCGLKEPRNTGARLGRRLSYLIYSPTLNNFQVSALNCT